MSVLNNDVLDINKYVKRDWESIKEDVLKLVDPKNITQNLLCELFSAQNGGYDSNGEIKVLPPKYRVTDYFDLPANILGNQPNAVKDTTFGIFIVNSLIINNSFHSKIGYINEEMNPKTLGKLHGSISRFLMEGKLNVEEYGTFIDTTLWLGYQTELTMPGVSLNLIVPRKSVKELKLKLLKENPEFLDTSKQLTMADVAKYVDNIEKPLIAKAKEELASDPASRLYNLAKPSFGNNYKNAIIENGPMMDSRTGGFRLNNNSFNDGSNAENFDLIANKAMYGSYSRGVNTAKGGTYAKYTNSMMQSVVLDKKGSDCGTTGLVNYTVTKDNWESIRYNFAMINGKLTRLDDDNLPGLIGKTIKMRSPLYCKCSGSKICNKCAGDTFYIIGIENIGLTSNIPMNASLNKSMKKMHDLTIKTVTVNPNDFLQFDK